MHREEDAATVPGARPPAAVLWDMDGTLVDSEHLWGLALQEAAESLGAVLTPEQLATFVGSNMQSTVQKLLQITGRSKDSGAAHTLPEQIRGRMLSLFAGPLPWRPGAHAALSVLRSDRVPSALVTSTERSLTDLALDTIGREFFHATVCGDEVDGWNKPHPEPYLRAARLLGVDPQHCLAVEDSPTGARSAAAAGCTVLVVPGEVPVAPGPRRILRSSLVGLDLVALTGLVPGH